MTEIDAARLDELTTRARDDGVNVLVLLRWLGLLRGSVVI